MYLSYVGIRVTNLARSLQFYTELFGLREVSRGDNTPHGGGIYVLLRDPTSGLKLELNWYPEGSPYGGPYVVGEGLDHIGFRVRNVPQAVQELIAKGVQPIAIPPALAAPGQGVQVAFLQDPDGNWIELYHNPRPMGPPIPEGY